jgi:hypothetical protein
MLIDATTKIAINRVDLRASESKTNVRELISRFNVIVCAPFQFLSRVYSDFVTD